jgi:hypothetical protein
MPPLDASPELAEVPLEVNPLSGGRDESGEHAEPIAAEVKSNHRPGATKRRIARSPPGGEGTTPVELPAR